MQRLEHEVFLPGWSRSPWFYLSTCLHQRLPAGTGFLSTPWHILIICPWPCVPSRGGILWQQVVFKRARHRMDAEDLKLISIKHWWMSEIFTSPRLNVTGFNNTQLQKQTNNNGKWSVSHLIVILQHWNNNNKKQKSYWLKPNSLTAQCDIWAPAPVFGSKRNKKLLEFEWVVEVGYSFFWPTEEQHISTVPPPNSRPLQDCMLPGWGKRGVGGC